jgi:hypothetical protein
MKYCELKGEVTFKLLHGVAMKGVLEISNGILCRHASLEAIGLCLEI